jgi:hypothetical protein
MPLFNPPSTAVMTATNPPTITSPAFASGTAKQLSDTTRDYMVYLMVGTLGLTAAIAIGPDSSVQDVIAPAGTILSAGLYPVRLPAGWYLKVTVATGIIAGQIAVGC